MQQGECFVYYSNDVLYSFPSLSCTDNSALPEFQSTTRNIYFIDSRGKLVFSSTDTISGNYLTTSYIAHLYNDNLFKDYSSYILPATFIVLAFFCIIYRWFIRLRG